MRRIRSPVGGPRRRWLPRHRVRLLARRNLLLQGRPKSNFRCSGQTQRQRWQINQHRRRQTPRQQRHALRPGGCKTPWRGNFDSTTRTLSAHRADLIFDLLSFRVRIEFDHAGGDQIAFTRCSQDWPGRRLGVRSGHTRQSGGQFCDWLRFHGLLWHHGNCARHCRYVVFVEPACAARTRRVAGRLG